MQVKDTLQHCRNVFPVAAYAVTSVPTYPTGQIGFVLGSLNSVSITHARARIYTHTLVI